MNKKVIIYAVLFSLSMLLSKTYGKSSPKEKFLDFDGYRVYYELYEENNSSKTLVFIHGWSGNIDIWRNQLNAFPNYRVIAIDLPGHGKSSKDTNAEYNITLFARSVNAVLVNEGIDKAFLFGHSMGFAVSEVFALKYPDKTIGIGSIDGAHFEVDKEEKAQSEWMAYNNMFAETLNEEKGRTDFIQMLLLPDTPARLKNEILESSRITPLPIGKKIIASMGDNMSYWEKRVVAIPCFVIHSPVYQLTAQYKQDFMKMYPQVQYHEIDGVSHFLMLEIPEVLNALMARFLEKVY